MAGGLDGFTRPQLDQLSRFLRDVTEGPVRVPNFTSRPPIALEDGAVEFSYDPADGTLRGFVGDRELSPDSAIVSVSITDGCSTLEDQIARRLS